MPKIDYQTTPAGHSVALNADYRMNADSERMGLYVIPCGGGCTTLGFARADEQAQAVRNWIEDESNGGAPELAGLYTEGGPVYAVPVPGTLAGYDFYKAAMAAGAAFNKRTGRRCGHGLTPELVGKEGHRVKILDQDGHECSRFWVGKSTGWMPCHLEIPRVDSSGGGSAYIPDGARVVTVRIS